MLARLIGCIFVFLLILAPVSILFDPSDSTHISVYIPTASAQSSLMSGALQVGSWFAGGTHYLFGWIFEWLFAFLGALIVYLAAIILGLAGSLFDVLLGAFAVNFTTTLKTLGIFDVIGQIWTIFRDLSQIVLIGFFIFIAINIILNNHEYSIKQHAVRAILVALFMNFSLFFSMAIIDVSNFVAYQFYRGIADVGGTVAPENIFGSNANVSKRIVTAYGLGSMNNFGEVVSKLKNSGAADWGGMIQILATSIGTAVMLLCAAIIFLYCSLLLLRRGVILVLVMISSSLAFAALIVPKFDSYFSQWRTALLSNAVFAPLLLLMLWTVIQIMDAVSRTNIGTMNPSIFTKEGIAQSGGSLVRFLFLLMVFYAAIKIADTLAKKGNELFGLHIGGAGNGMAFGGMLAATPFGATQNLSRARAAARLKAQRDEVESKLGKETDTKKRQGLIDQREKIQKRIESGGGAFSAKIDKILGSMQKLATGKEAKGTAIKDIIKKKDDKEKAEAKKIVEAAQPRVDADKAYDQHIGQQQKIAEKGQPPSEEDTKALTVKLGAVETTRKELAEKAAAQPEPKTDVEKQEQAKNVKAIQEHDEQIKQLRSQINKQAEEREAYQTAQNDLAQFAAPDEKTRTDARNRFIERQMQAANNPTSSAAAQQKARLEQTIRSTLGVENKRVLDMATSELLKDKATKEREKLFGLLEKAGEKAETPKAEAPKGPAAAPAAAAKADDHAAPH